MPTQRPGPVPKPKPKPYLYRDLFRQNVQEQFTGTNGGIEDITSDDGKAKIAAAHKATQEALGYTLDEAVAQDELEDIYRDLQYSKPRTGEEELGCCEVEL